VLTNTGKLIPVYVVPLQISVTVIKILSLYTEYLNFRQSDSKYDKNEIKEENSTVSGKELQLTYIIQKKKVLTRFQLDGGEEGKQMLFLPFLSN